MAGVGTFQERLAKLAGVGPASQLNKYRLYSAKHDLQNPLNAYNIPINRTRTLNLGIKVYEAVCTA